MERKTQKIISVLFDESRSFLERAVFAFNYQREHNPAYATFASHFISGNKEPRRISEIPLMPIRAFKEMNLIVDGKQPEVIFKSSGTGTMNRSTHPVADLDLYRKSITEGFNKHFNLDRSTILCYTPGYADNPDSSLLWMLNYLTKQDFSGRSRFLPLDEPLTTETIESALDKDHTLILFGAAFGLLDLIEAGSSKLPKSAHIIETGGMKTHRREMSKHELRQRLSDGFGTDLMQIHSEYGMCELLSQMYAIGGETFKTPHWMKASVRNPEDPFDECAPEFEGKIGIIDLANIYSCPFILTDDRGLIDMDGNLSVLGRWQTAELRGCNFLIDREV